MEQIIRAILILFAVPFFVSTIAAYFRWPLWIVIVPSFAWGVLVSRMGWL